MGAILFVKDLHEDIEGFGGLPRLDMLGEIGAEGLEDLLPLLAGKGERSFVVGR